MAKVEHITQLEHQIDKAIADIHEGKTNPTETGIGKLFSQLKEIDEASYFERLEVYKPIAKAYFDTYKLTDEYKKKKAAEDKKLADIRRKDAEFAMLLKGGGSSMSGDDEIRSGPRVMKDSKAKKLPKIKVPKEKRPKAEKGIRDRSGYMFNGETYGKGQLVRAIISAHVENNKNITLEQLKKAFPAELLKGYGPFQTHEKALAISKVKKRFFLNDSQLIRLKDKVVISVCSQFSKDNIGPFLECAKGLGFKIE